MLALLSSPLRHQLQAKWARWKSMVQAQPLCQSLNYFLMVCTLATLEFLGCRERPRLDPRTGLDRRASLHLDGLKPTGSRKSTES